LCHRFQERERKAKGLPPAVGGTTVKVSAEPGDADGCNSGDEDDDDGADEPEAQDEGRRVSLSNEVLYVGACACTLIPPLDCDRCLCMYHGCLTYADGALLFIRRRARQQGACSTHVNGSAALLSEQAGIQAHRHAQRGQAVPLD